MLIKSHLVCGSLKVVFDLKNRSKNRFLKINDQQKMVVQLENTFNSNKIYSMCSDE